jgi:hypothetical protein
LPRSKTGNIQLKNKVSGKGGNEIRRLKIMIEGKITEHATEFKYLRNKIERRGIQITNVIESVK